MTQEQGAAGARETSVDGDWLDINRANWNERVAIHRRSRFYNVDAFLAGQSTLSKYELAALGNVSGRSLLHLQCHFGLDSLSWAREGAVVAGLDFSPPAIREARALAKLAGIDAEFQCANVYDAGTVWKHKFDIIYTGLGALCWLPDIDEWAQVVARLLETDGVLFLYEFHPTEWVFDENQLSAKYDYFTPADGLRIDLPGSYADPGAITEHNATVQWNHSIGAVVTALIKAGLVIQKLEEYNFSRVRRWPFMVENGNGFFVMPTGYPNLPLAYALQAKQA